MLGDSSVFIVTRDNYTIKGTACRGTEGLWELLMRKNVNTELINKNYLKKYKKY